MSLNTINADLTQMSYEQFKTFMRGIASLYSNMHSTSNFNGLLHDMRTMAKKIAMLPMNITQFFGAYEIAHNQVVLAIFTLHIDFGDDENPTEYIEKIEVSFAEDTPYLRCPSRIRDLLTQPDYVARSEQAYPRGLDEMLWEKWKPRREGFKLNLTQAEMDELEKSSIPF